jgi:hypothetical protein
MKNVLTVFFFASIVYLSTVLPQTNGNIPLHSKSKYNRYYGVGDVWGVQNGGVNYDLVTLACPPLEEWWFKHCEYK